MRAFEQRAVEPPRIAGYRAHLPRDLARRRALVIDCGRRRLAKNSARAGAEVLALDTAPEPPPFARATAGREALPIACQRASGEALPADDATVASVTAGESPSTA